MNCVIYLRVSTKEQAEGGYSIPAQKEACVKYIKDKGWNLIDEYADRGESARSARRPQLQEMLFRIKKQKDVHAVVVHKIDRLARNMPDHVAIKAVISKYGATLVSVVENIDDTASGRFIEGIHALMAEFYSANLGMEAKKGMGQKAKKGGWPYQAPVGYLNTRDEDRKAIIVPDPEMAPLVKEAFELYATGEYSIVQLHEMMSYKGLKTKRSNNLLSRSRLAGLLKNKAYIGIVTWNGVEYPGIHEPLISNELFARVQEVLESHDKAGTRIRKHPHYLRGSLYCGYCGARLTSTLAKGKYVYFFCAGKKRGNKCDQIHISESVIEKEMLKLYEKIQLSPSAVEKLTLKFENELVSRESTNLKQREFIARKMARLNNERDKLLQAYYGSAIPLDLLKKEQDRISRDMAELESKQVMISCNLEQVDRVVRLTIKMAANCYLAYKKASPNTKRMINQAVFEKIYLKGNEISGFEYTEPFKNLMLSNCSNSDTLARPTGFEPVTLGLEGHSACFLMLCDILQ